MVFIEIDKNSYIQRPNSLKMETKEATPYYNSNIGAMKDNFVLSNNLETMTFYGSSSLINQPVGYRSLSNYIKVTPELLSIITAYVTDILSDGYTFVSKNEFKCKRAQEFSDAQNLQLILNKWLVDCYTYGNGFLVTNFVPEEMVKQVIDASMYEIKELGYEYKQVKEIVDEVAYKNMLIQNLPAVTVSIFAKDKYGDEVKYKQTVGTNVEFFDQTEVIHIKDIDLDGKLWGHSRLFNIISEIQTLANAKDYIGNFFNNNGTPNMIFTFPNVDEGSPQYNDIVRQLKDLKRMENKQSNVVFTSDVKVDRLNDFKKDLEFEKLIKIYTEILAMTFQMPSTRYGMPSGGNGEGATLTNQGYYRNISATQDKIERILNNQLFKPIFDCEFKFNRSYKEDELREVQIMKTNADIAVELINAGLMTKRAAAKEIMHIEDENLPENIDEIVDPMEGNSQFMQGQKKPIELEDEPQQHDKKNKTPKKYK